MKNTIYLIAIIGLQTACLPKANNNATEQATEAISVIDSSTAIQQNQVNSDQKQSQEKVQFNFIGHWVIPDNKCFSKESEGLQIKHSKDKENQYNVEMTLLDDFGVEYWFKGNFLKDNNGILLSSNIECSTGDTEVKNAKVIIRSIDDNKIEVKVIDKNREWLSCAPDNRILLNRKY